MTVVVSSQAVLTFQWRRFDELELQQLYDILALRQMIFIVEQNAPQLDADGRDSASMHLLACQDGRLVGYLRVLPRDLYQPGAVSFGRVVVRQDMRRSGLGARLVDHAIAYLDEFRCGAPIRISSQLYLKAFYERWGFVASGKPYIEDHVWHIAMERL